MEKRAITAFPISDINATRWSPRLFADKPVSREQVGSLLEAARWAPSCFNEQPWRFIVGIGFESEPYGKILATLVEGNRTWAATAPVLMISVASTRFEQNGKENRHAAYDTGQAVSALAAEATSMGLFLHQMAGFDADAARAAFNIPADCQPMAAIALGYLGDPSHLGPEMKEREMAARLRKPLADLAFGSSWGDSW